MKVKLLFIALKIPGVIGNVNNVDLKNHCLVVVFFHFFSFFYFILCRVGKRRVLGAVDMGWLYDSNYKVSLHVFNLALFYLLKAILYFNF